MELLKATIIGFSIGIGFIVIGLIFSEVERYVESSKRYKLSNILDEISNYSIIFGVLIIGSYFVAFITGIIINLLPD